MRYLLILVMVVGLARAAEQPEYPGLDLPEQYTIVLKGREVPSVYWRNGRPHVHINEVGPRLNLPMSGDTDVDVLAAAKARGYVARFEAGVLTLSPPETAAVSDQAQADQESRRADPPWATASSASNSTSESHPAVDVVAALLKACRAGNVKGALQCCDFEIGDGADVVPVEPQVRNFIRFLETREIAYEGVGPSGEYLQFRFTVNGSSKPLIINVKQFGSRWLVTAINMGNNPWRPR